MNSALNLSKDIRWLNIPKYENKRANTQTDICVNYQDNSEADNAKIPTYIQKHTHARLKKECHVKKSTKKNTDLPHAERPPAFHDTHLQNRNSTNK